MEIINIKIELSISSSLLIGPVSDDLMYCSTNSKKISIKPVAEFDQLQA